MMKGVPVLGVFVSAIILLIPLTYGHPHPSCSLIEKGEKKYYNVNEEVEIHCPEHNDKKYKVVCTDKSSWLELTQCPGTKPTAKPTTKPKPTEKYPDPPRMPDRPPMRPQRPRRPFKPRMPDRRPHDYDMRPDYDHRPRRPQMPEPKPYEEDHRPMPDPHSKPSPEHPPRKPDPPVYTTKPMTKYVKPTTKYIKPMTKYVKPTTKYVKPTNTVPTGPHIVPPINLVNPIPKQKPCSIHSVPQFVPYNPFNPQLATGIPSGGRVTLICPGYTPDFHFDAYCYDGMFYWQQYLCPPLFI